MTCGECGNVTAPGAGFPNHVYCKRFLLHMEKRKDASRCRDFIPKPKTNADYIRAMNDEELADFLYATWKEQDAFSKDVCKRCPNTSCQPKCWLDWLRQEAEEGEDAQSRRI